MGTARVEEPSASPPAQPTLVSGDVTLRPWRLGDESTILPLYDTEIARWFGLSRDTPALPRMQEAIRRWHRGYADARGTVSFLVVRTADPVPVGTCQVRDDGDRVGVVSWSTFAPYRRTGYATSALLALCRYAYDELHLERLEAHVEPGSRTRQRAVVRSGFAREGLMRAKRTVDGTRRDLVLYARLATDPEPVLRLRRRPGG
ncbi:MAG: GNAT family N-acetyltransferase [Streptosporangiales bacterium]|nr:GNAT family N-acetyltransferase [Streptosporangiales bacterium]MBO0891394.1 GNAT family N-acetyltransferase [Acidothermales bacterium]